MKRHFQQHILRTVQWLHRQSVSAGKSGKFWWTAGCLAFIVMGISLLWNTFQASAVSQASKNWPEVLCKVIVSTAQELSREQLIGKSWHRYYYYKPEVVCEYKIADMGSAKKYIAYRYRISVNKTFQGHTRLEDKTRAAKWATENYPKGMMIRVYIRSDDCLLEIMPCIFIKFHV